jgi:UDP-N-acetyl-D-glucosamine dehydrogenase
MSLINSIKNKSAKIGIIGLGYVGLPLARIFCNKNFYVIGFDIDNKKIELLKNRKTYIKHIDDNVISEMIDSGKFSPTADFSLISNVDIIIICVPTPLSIYREPDLGPVLNTGESISPHIKKNQLIILESSTYPGTTSEELAKVLERSGLKANTDFHIAYSPEREDPGNKDFGTDTIPKVVGADSPEALELSTLLYEQVISSVTKVSNTKTAEAVKLTENIFRSVNIALSNELKIIFDEMDIDVWEVIDAAASKPFGFMPFYPGPGVGGHCIPIDPFYLTYKAREFGVATRFIELAGEINNSMPSYVVEKAIKALNDHSKKALNGSKLLMIGIAYKKNVDDMRESPSLVLLELLEKNGAIVDYHDSYVPKIPVTRDHERLSGRKSVSLDPLKIKSYDLIVIGTNHSNCDYQLLLDHGNVILDTRNAMKGLSGKAIIEKA